MCMKLQAMGFGCAATGNGAAILAKLAANATKTLSCSKGEYRLWQSTAGAQIYFHYPRDRDAGAGAADTEGGNGAGAQAMGLTPFHLGKSKVTILVERSQIPDKLNPLEGHIRAKLRSPDAVGPDPQLRLEMVPFALQRRARRPFMAEAQIVGFAHQVLAFETADDYLLGVPAPRLIAPGAMTRVRRKEIEGLKLGCGDNDYALGLVTGRIERAQRLLNPSTGAPYYWLVLKANAGLIDIVTSPGSVSGDVSEGHTAQVCASFVGRLLDTPSS